MVTAIAFEECLRPVLAAEAGAITRRIARRRIVYAGGAHDEKVYFIEAGLVKVVMQSAGGKECLLEIYAAGDFFGECGLSGGQRSETAVAMTDTVLKQIGGARFLALILEAGLMEKLIRCLAVRLNDQQQTITNLSTVDCEHRLGATLLRLSRKLGASGSGVLQQKISHQELSQMVGTTRPRVSEFMQKFRDLGLIDITPDSRILVRERRLREYLDPTERGAPLTVAS